MPTLEQPRIERENVGRCLVRAVLFATLCGAVAGSVESLKVLATTESRTTGAALELVGIAIGGYAIAGALLAIPCALLALSFYGRPTFRVAPASTCVALGVCIGLTAELGASSIGLELLAALALAGTLICLMLREMLAWWSFAGRARLWLGALALLLLANAIAVALSVPSRPSKSEPANAARTNVLLVTIDTLRSDHLGCYGDVHAHTPTIDRLASEGVLFEDATSQANTTGPSHTTILTGLYPAEHGAVANGTHIANRAKTLADVLAPTHTTAAFVSGFPLVDRACGLGARFDLFDDQLLLWHWVPHAAEHLHLVQSVIRCAESRGIDVRRADRPADETVDCALEWLEAHKSEPFFCWLHLFDPHAPYAPPAPIAALMDPNFGGKGNFNWYELKTPEREALVKDARAVKHMKALYAGEIAYADEQLGRLIDALRADATLDRTLVVLAADHGEAMGSHQYWFDHGLCLYDEELHVPLVMRLPGAQHAGLRVANQVRLLDIAPTVLDVLSVPSPSVLSGASLMPLVDGEHEANDRPSYAIGDLAGNVTGFDIDGRRSSLRVQGHKVIWSSPYWLDTQRVDARTQMFDLAADPDEQHDLAATGTKPAQPFQDLTHQLELWRTATDKTRDRGALDAETFQQLHKLGYL